jgi:hypothetical protein
MKLRLQQVDSKFFEWHHRLVSEKGLIHMGVHPVIYGYRVRAGFTFDIAGCTLDWCGGGHWPDVERLYAILRNILEQRPESQDVFDDLPLVSQVKPFYLDISFTREILKKVDLDFSIQPLVQVPRQPMPWVYNQPGEEQRVPNFRL